jgi:hypothetical protein
MRREFVRALWRVSPFKRLIKTAYHSRANPRYWRQVGRACSLLSFDFGLLPSLVRQAPVARDGTPIPWYTYPAIEYLSQFDFRDKVVFEYGAGNSTLFWASRAARVVSVEHEPEWHGHLSARLPANCQLFFEDRPERYVGAIDRLDEHYDLIVIDGQSRQLCAAHATQRLKSGGLVILDNSDWFPASSQLLREAGLMEVDFFGFAPANDVTSSTSIYFDRVCTLQTRGRQPRPGIGAMPNSFDETWWKP